MTLRTRLRLPIGAAAVALAVNCGGSPAGPGPVPPPGGGATPPPNNVPVIQSITLQGSRPHQPSDFADLSDVIEVSAVVRDDETPVDQLQYVWSAPAGTFGGTGARVTWQAPAQASNLPAEITIRLELVERYGSPQSFEHRVSGTSTLMLHDSVREVGDMARQFLLDFSDSNIQDVNHIMRNFDPGCYGTADEAAQVAQNRREFRINTSSVGAASVTVNFGGICSFRARPGDACARVPVSWSSTFLATGATESVSGTDQIAAVYRPDQHRWRLCDSQFEGTLSQVMLRFIR